MKLMKLTGLVDKLQQAGKMLTRCNRSMAFTALKRAGLSNSGAGYYAIINFIRKWLCLDEGGVV